MPAHAWSPHPPLPIVVRAHTEMMMGAQWCYLQCGRPSAAWPAATSWSRSSTGGRGGAGPADRSDRPQISPHRRTCLRLPSPPLATPPDILPSAFMPAPALSSPPHFTPLRYLTFGYPSPPTNPFPPSSTHGMHTEPCALTPLSRFRYLPIGGLKDFNVESIKLAYGDHADVIRHGQVAVVQSLSGTGSCRLMAEFQVRGELRGERSGRGAAAFSSVEGGGNCTARIRSRL